jgi:hypothetical protein
MRIYLAAAFSRKEEIRKIAEELVALGINVQARWLYEPECPAKPAETDRFVFMCERAEIDEEDVLAADVLVRFSDDLNTPSEMVEARLATGARMVEMGMARVNGAKLIVVGGHQCVFDYWREVTHINDVTELKTYLLAFKAAFQFLEGQ